MQNTTLAKALQFSLPLGVVYLPFTGNLIQSKKDAMADSITSFINSEEGKTFLSKKDVHFSKEDILSIIDENYRIRVEKDVAITYHNYQGINTVSIMGKGWGMSGHPVESLKILTF